MSPRKPTEAVYDEPCRHWKGTVICPDQDLKVDVMFGHDGEIMFNVTSHIIHTGGNLPRYVLSEFRHVKSVVVKLVALDEDEA